MSVPSLGFRNINLIGKSTSIGRSWSQGPGKNQLQRKDGIVSRTTVPLPWYILVAEV
jgi:hypothetical protein